MALVSTNQSSRKCGVGEYFRYDSEEAIVPVQAPKSHKKWNSYKNFIKRKISMTLGFYVSLSGLILVTYNIKTRRIL